MHYGSCKEILDCINKLNFSEEDKFFTNLQYANNVDRADEQKSFLIEQERIRKEYQNKIQIDHQNSLRNMENQINQLNEKNKQLESRPPQIIYQGGGGGKRRCQIF